jgi:hypothetical protein
MVSVPARRSQVAYATVGAALGLSGIVPAKPHRACSFVKAHPAENLPGTFGPFRVARASHGINGNAYNVLITNGFVLHGVATRLCKKRPLNGGLSS